MPWRGPSRRSTKPASRWQAKWNALETDTADWRTQASLRRRPLAHQAPSTERGGAPAGPAPVAGPAWALQQAGLAPKGIDAVLCGDVPLGGGLSSSASLEVALVGARMTGGGFGGCTVNLVVAEEADAFAAELTALYRAASGGLGGARVLHPGRPAEAGALLV